MKTEVKKTIKKLPKQRTISQLVKELDRVFSLFIRHRNKTSYGFARCFTCCKLDDPKNLQCGHYWSRFHKSTRWDEQNCEVQCVRCNIFMEGNKPVFTKRLIEKHGKDILDILEMRKNNRSNLGRFELELLINLYKQKINAKGI